MGKTITVELLGEEKFLRFWPSISVQLDTVPHTWDTYWTKETLREFVLSGRFQCWGIGPDQTATIICFTQIVCYPAGNIMKIFLAFGQGIDEAIPVLLATFEKFAIDNGCKLMEIPDGRGGWEPKLRKVGFRRLGVTLGRRVETTRIM